MKSNKTLILLTLTFVSIVSLQGYSVFMRYKNEKKAFDEKINWALKQSIQNIHEQKREEVIKNLKRLILSDSLSSFSINWSENHKTYMITLTDKEKNTKGQHTVNFSKSMFSTKFDVLTPDFKEEVLNEWLKDVKLEMQKGFVWYYTQAIGQFVNEKYFENLIKTDEVLSIFNQKLSEQNIETKYKLKASSKADIASKSFEVQLKNGHAPLQVFFENPFLDLFKQQAIPILGSLLLMILSFLSFTYIYKSLITHQKLNLQKNQLMVNITHELKTPIAAIQASAEALQKFDWTNEQKQSFFTIINQQSQKLDDLCNEILDQIRLTKTEVKLEKIQLKSLLDDLSNSFPNLQITNAVPNSCFIFSDKKILSKAINNLLDNAYKYNDSEIKTCLIESQIAQSFLEISFTDNGIGISEENQMLVFEKFYRISNTEIHNQKGYGIGLNYTKEALEILGGKISLKSNTNQGSQFIIQIPL